MQGNNSRNNSDSNLHNSNDLQHLPMAVADSRSKRILIQSKTRKGTNKFQQNSKENIYFQYVENKV